MTGLAVAALAVQHAVGALPIPLAQWLFGLPPVFLGVAFAVARDDPNRVVVSGVVAGAGLIVAYIAGWMNGLLQMSVATLALFLCLKIKLPDTGSSRWAAGMSLGVYLVHPLIASGLQRTTSLVPGSATYAAGVIAGALVASVALRHLGVFAATWFRRQRATTGVNNA